MNDIFYSSRHKDPCQRLLLECSYESLVDAGYQVDNLTGRRVGVYVGIMGYSDKSTFDVFQQSGKKNSMTVYSSTGNTLSVAPGRTSHTFNLSGPCVSVDTACSSACTALHSEKLSLQNETSDMAILLGANYLHLHPSIDCAITGMTSPDGKCHAFDKSANGYCRGEGCGALVLKRLSDAVRDGDGIYAVVRGSAVMQDGKSGSLTARKLRTALSDAGVSPSKASVND